jgi:hypothetical protein
MEMNILISYSNVLLLIGGIILYSNVYQEIHGYVPSSFDSKKYRNELKYHKTMSKLGIRLFALGTALQIISSIIPFIPKMLT